MLVASALHQDIQDVSILINSSPQIVGFAVDFQIHLVHMPCVSRFRTATAQLVGIHLPKFQEPLTHCFMRHHDSALCQKFFDIAKAERKAEIEPNRVADDAQEGSESLCSSQQSCLFS